jgi:hypothetical protein
VRIGDKTNHPSWGFPPPLFGGVLGEEGEGGRALPRRAVGGKGQAARAAALRWAREEPESGPGARNQGRREHGPRRRTKGGARRREQLHRRNAFTPEHQRPAFVRPATSTPSPRREHHGLPLLFSPLDSCCVGTCVEARRCELTAWMPAFAPQHCRAATDGALGPIVSLGAAVAVRRATRTRAGELVEQRRGDAPRLPQAGGRALLEHAVAVRGQNVGLAVES